MFLRGWVRLSFEAIVNFNVVLLFACLCALIGACAPVVVPSDDGVAVVDAGGEFMEIVDSVAEVEFAPVDYSLQVGDVLAVTVYGEADLSRAYTIDPQGMIAVPLIGDVTAAGLSVMEVRQDITAKLKNGYLVRPSVSVDIASLQPFYIMGEVRAPGSYSYTSNLTILNAVALAGGFTYRANRRKVSVSRGGEGEATVPLDHGLKPGDTIIVKERFF